MQIGCNNFSMGMLSVYCLFGFLGLCLFVENSSFVHWKNCGFDLSKSLSIHEHQLYVVINFFQLFLPFSSNRNLQTFEESFSYACPKFISPVPPNFDAPPANFNRVRTFQQSSNGFAQLCCVIGSENLRLFLNR